jgi:putative FmdB family regulatory protein
MPTYQYKASDAGCDFCRPGFEQVQSMKDEPLTACPKCGGPVHKIPSLFSGGVPMLSNGHLRDKGFTKLQKRSDGSYEKTT